MMLLWFIIGTGVITISALAVAVSLYLAATNWLHHHLGGDDE